ncbi:MAG: 50S ribosomal protein L24 [Flavobacteriaceae bacterium]|nr:MAG: 50S ribosomal protein L24 [Flavobacteriaceae bacterium]
MSSKIKKGDKVFVLAGSSKDLTNTKEVLRVFPDKNKAIVAGVNMIKKHTKPSAQNPKGGIVEMEAPINLSNLALAEDGKPVRVGFKFEDGKKVRISKRTGKTI